MSFGGQNNAPWQRNNIMQNQMSYPQQQIFMQQQNLSSGFGGGNFQSNSGSVGYQQRGLNPVAFSSSGNAGQTQHYNSIGTVTKMSGDCGLVNDEVFFYRNVCKGQIPQLGDRVLFEASISTSGQYKWDATRIQLMGQQAQPPPLMGTGRGKNSGYNAVPPPNEYDRLRFNSPRRSSPDRHELSRREANRRSRDRDDIDHDRKRRREDNDRNRDVSLSARSAANSTRAERDRDESKREREKDRSPQRPGRKPRIIRRYRVQIPKSTLVYKSADTQEIRQRFYKLYIPSDFFNANIKWSETFTPDNPFSLRRPCQFHIMHKIVEPPYEQNADALEPSDADYIYSAKVMLMGCPPIAEIYQKCFEDDDSENAQHNVHLSRLITFLVGTRGRHEPMAIGGPWSPSMDGKNPDKDPAVLIRTAIRTCKALTGIDLSNCTQWYRFMEIHYHRSDYKHKKKDGSPRVETVVIYVPDVHSCMPTTSQWQNLAETYKTSVDNVIARNQAAAAAKSSAVSEIEGDSTGNSTLANDSVAETDNKIGADGIADKIADAVDSQEDVATDENMEIDNSEPSLDVSIDGDDKNIEKDNLQPTHYSKLDLKSMKVKDIRDELMARNLPYKGVRNLIMARLAKAINMEKSNDLEAQNPNSKKVSIKSKEIEQKNATKEIVDTKTEVKDGDEITENKSEYNDEQEEWGDIMDMRDIVILDEYDSSKNPEEINNEMDEKEKSQLIRRYSLPNDPHIIVHPNKTAKDGKFDCTVMSLSVLLDYRPDDAKERFFEISLFAELFNEMLMRDFGFNIYKELYLHEGSKVEVSETKDEINKDIKKEEIKKEETTEKPKENVKSEENKLTKPANERKRKPDNSNKEREKDNAEKNKEKEKEKSVEKKIVVVKPHLLLSFIYFDITHCGYIFQKDLEELFHIIGLNLSRGQIRSVLEKVSSHQICYRKLTDKEESLDAPPTIQDADEIPADLLKKIALGNRHYDFIFGDNTLNRTTKYSNENGDGLMNYNGAIIHVGKLVEQIKRTELNYSNLETIHNDLSKSHAELQKEYSKSNAKVKDLQTKIKSLNRKLSDTNQELNSLNRKHRDEQSTLLYIYNRVSPYFREKKKDKEKEHSSRDKEIQKTKEQDKSKEKDAKDGKEKDSNDSKEKDSKESNDSKDIKEKDAKDTKEKDSKVNKEKEKNKDNQKQNEKKKKSNTDANLNNDENENKSDIKNSSENIPNKDIITTEEEK